MRIQGRPSARRPSAIPASYSLEVQHPETGETGFETHDSLPAVVARAAQLIQAGYRIGIWSPTSFERHWGHPLRSISATRCPTLSLGA